MLTQADLDQFIGTEKYHSHWLKRFKYTDGVKHLAEEGGAYWLLDAIGSHQPILGRHFRQFWSLQVFENHTATLSCSDGDGGVPVSQSIPYTDFPLPEVKLWLIDDILLLPSEY